MPNLIHTLLDKISGILFPAKCLGCAKPGEFLCEICRKRAQRRAREKTSPLYLDRFLSYGLYRDRILREALRRFKYHGIHILSHPLSQMLHDLLKPGLSSLPKETLILPIPASPERRRERGYNQAELLAEGLSEKISLPCRADILLKIKNTPSQTSLSRRERLFNIKDSFTIQNPEELLGKTILLVDDISTTGATLSEAARVLKQAGAKEVIGLVVARG
ncbi:MAG: ComF family protein [bacterium]|nr:ComF family protein [bacterium]